jgi:hypothetical protein
MENDTNNYNGLAEEDILEFLLWQSPSIGNSLDISLNVTAAKDPIAGLENEYLDTYIKYMQAIGVRSTSSSVTGTANNNGLGGTFSNFKRLDPVHGIRQSDVPRLGIGMPAMLLQGNMSVRDQPWDIYHYPFERVEGEDEDYTVIGRNIPWMSTLFDSVGMPSTFNKDIQKAYSSCTEREVLKRAIENAYKTLCAGAHV